MNLSRGPQKRWVIEGVDEDVVRWAKALAAEHGVRVADVVDAAIEAAWRYHVEGTDPREELERLLNAG